MLEVAKNNVSNILTACKEMINAASFNRSFRAVVTEKVSSKIYKVSYKDSEYKVWSDYNLSVGDNVWVCAPGNDWDSLYVQTYDGFRDNVITTSKLVNNGSTNVAGLALDARYGTTLTTQNNTTASNLTTHKTSSDHDSRYYTETEVDSKFTTHKSSGDHDSRYYTETEINSKLAFTSGYATINTTYVTTIGTSYVRWKKFGRVVCLELYDIRLKSGYSTDNATIVASGLPPAQNESISSIAGLETDNGNRVIQVRLLVDGSGLIKPWYFGNPLTYSIMINGSFTYISAS